VSQKYEVRQVFMRTTVNRRNGWRLTSGGWFRAMICLALLSSGCIRTAAKTTPEGPPLDMPTAPPREAEPNDAEPPQPMPLIAEPARNAPARARPVPRETVRPEPPKVDPPKAEPAPPVEPPKPPEEPAKPPVSLQTAPAQAEVDAERLIRASLSKANVDLNRIDYRALNADARTQYDTAKRFIRQADDALKTKNLVFAKNLAEKAAALATQLGGR
jgi:hypothetical protein